MDDTSTKISSNQKVGNPRRKSIGIPDSSGNGKTIYPPVRRASVGSSHVGGNMRRNSTGIATPRNNGESIIPNYLRASTGSCHDFCKYGRKHENEVKPWKFKPKKAVESSSEEQSNANVVTGGTKKTTMVKVKPSSEPAEAVKQKSKTAVSREKNTAIAKLKISPEPPEVIERSATAIVPPGKKNTVVVKLEHSPDPPKVVKQNNASVVPRERKKTAIIVPSPEPPEQIIRSHTTLDPGKRKKATMGILKSSPEPQEVIKREILLSSGKVELSSKQDSLCDKKVTHRDLKLPAKRSLSLKPKPAKDKIPSSSDASVGSNGRKKADMKTGTKAGQVKAAVKKVLVIPTVSLSSKSSLGRVLSFKARKVRNLKQVSPIKDQSQISKGDPMQIDNDEVHKKTLHTVDSEDGNNVSGSLQTDGIVQSFPCSQPTLALSPKSSHHANSHGSYSEQDDLDHAEYTSSEDDKDNISENDEIVNPSGETLKEHKMASRKGQSSLPEEQAAGVKLKFRRGRIVDVQSDNNVPRRLRFRRGRVLGGEDEKCGSRRRSFKKREDDETKVSQIGTEKVVLKHQDVQEGKKDRQGLFNNVIEETASKLVESRKSKVKALVGAFETVISLQDVNLIHR